MISSALYPLIFSAPSFHLAACPSRSSAKMAYSLVLSTIVRKDSPISSNFSCGASSKSVERPPLLSGDPGRFLDGWSPEVLSGEKRSLGAAIAHLVPRHGSFDPLSRKDSEK